jgi:NAD(P)-dependent dehydrogenase (short-subunit alcohol dehydrogenase family)
MSDPAPTASPASSAEFAGKVALVVGASRGIGAATARRFAARGARVLLAARDRPALERVADEIAARGGSAATHPVDIGDAASVHALGGWVAEQVGHLDCAFNNAGDGYAPTPLADVPPAEFERVQRVTVTGMFLALREEIPLVLAAGGGAIVNMSSTAGLSGFAGGGPYMAAKHAVLGLTKSAALDYAARGVRVNAVAPGPIETDRIHGLPDAAKARIREAVPMRRLGAPDDVADTVLWLCGDGARFVTGATILVDGGRLAGVA